MADDRKVFADSVTPLPPTEGPTHLGLMVARARPETSKERMTVVFSLALPDSAQADLQKMVAEGKVVSPKQLSKNYSADANDAKALSSWYAHHFGLKLETYEDGKVYGTEFKYRRLSDSSKVDSTVFSITQSKVTLPPERKEAVINYRVRDLAAFLEQLKADGIERTPTIGSSRIMRPMRPRSWKVFVISGDRVSRSAMRPRVRTSVTT